MSENLIANLVLGWICVGWPGVVGLVCFGLGRYGALGMYRGLVLRLKMLAPPEAE